MTASERGTASHRAMQLLNLGALAGLSGNALVAAIRNQLDAFADERLITDEQFDAVSPAMLARFLESETGLRLRAARDVRREVSFNLMMPAAEALTRAEAGGAAGTVLVQGTIDLCFLEDGKWVLVDYKTSRADDLAAIQAHYALQLGLYAKALERITKIEVKEKILALIAQGVEARV